MKEKQAERLMNLMSQLPDELLEEAVSYQAPRSRTIPWNKGHLVAACLCLCLIGGLAWSLNQEPLEETKATMAGVITGGTSGQGEKPTLAPGGGPTGAGSVVSTDTETLISEFYYQGELYVDTGVMVEELPEACTWIGRLTGEDGTARDQSLFGSEVYGIEGDKTGLYVRTEDGYRHYERGNVEG